MVNKKHVFVRTPVEKYAYRWEPKNDPVSKAKRTRGKDEPICNATPGSNGEDQISSYCHTRVVGDDGIVKKFAYVECGYVL